VASKTGRRQKRQERSRRRNTGAAPSPIAQPATPARGSKAANRKARTLRSTRWVLLAAIVTTIAACADAALLAVADGSDRWLYGVGLLLWVVLAAYHWNRWISARRRL
jgi:hypothetical protein